MATDLDLKKSILLVDDDQSFVTVVEHVLGMAGYSVRSVYTAKDAFASVEAGKPDLIILDIVLPDMNGLQVLRRLKETSETSSIPVILLTGKREYQDVLQGYQLGGDYYMIKPFTSAQLLAGIRLLLDSEQADIDSRL